MIQLHDKQFVPFISAAEIDKAVAKMAAQVMEDMKDETPVFVGVLNGAFMVVSDFLKHYSKPCEVTFVKLSSYEGTSSTHSVKQLLGINQNLEGRTEVTIDDYDGAGGGGGAIALHADPVYRRLVSVHATQVVDQTLLRFLMLVQQIEARPAFTAYVARLDVRPAFQRAEEKNIAMRKQLGLQ